MCVLCRLRGRACRRVRQDAAACATESTITLSSASTVVQANGTTEIRAIVLESSGTPVQNGTTVSVHDESRNAAAVEARTQNGVATVQFLGNGQSGKATIKALSGGSASEALELSVGAGASGRVSVTANPASVPAAGGTTTIYRGCRRCIGESPVRSACEFQHDCRHVQLRRCEHRCIRNRAHDV